MQQFVQLFRASGQSDEILSLLKVLGRSCEAHRDDFVGDVLQLLSLLLGDALDLRQLPDRRMSNLHNTIAHLSRYHTLPIPSQPPKRTHRFDRAEARVAEAGDVLPVHAVHLQLGDVMEGHSRLRDCRT